MKQKSLPILLAACLALGAGFWWIRRERLKTPERSGTRSALLAALEGRRPDSLTVRDREGLHYYKVEWKRGAWFLTDPIRDEAHPGKVRSLLEPLGMARKELVRKKEDLTKGFLEEAGLSPPKGWIEVGAGERRLRIELGGEDVVPDRAFARIEGDVYRVPLGLDAAFGFRHDELRNPFLFRTGPESFLGLVLERRAKDGGRLRLELRRDGGRGFRLVSPFEAKASKARVLELIGNLLAVRADRFRALVEPRRDLFEDPWLHVVIQGTGRREEAWILEPERSPERNRSLGLPPGDEEVYAKRKGREVLFLLDPRSLGRTLTTPVEGLLDTSLWPFDPARARRIQLRGGPNGRRWVLEALGDRPGFRLLQPELRETDPGALTDLFGLWKSLRVVAIYQGPAAEKLQERFRAGAFDLRIESPRESSLPDLEYEIAESPRGGALVRRKGEGILLEVRGGLRGSLDRPWWRFAGRTAFRFRKESPALVVRIEGPGGTRTYEREAGEGWVLDGRAAPDFEEVLDRLVPLRARRIAGPFLEASAPPLVGKIRFLGPKDPAGRPAELGVLVLYSGPDGEGLLAREEGDRLLFALSPVSSRFLRGLFPR